MPKVEYRTFGGMRPGRHPELLAPGEATLATNVRLNDGSIEPLAGLSASVITLASGSQVKSLYRFGQTLTSDTQYWFERTDDANFVKGPIADDTEERTYFTAAGTYPRKTNAAIATGTAPLPVSSYRMGIVRPGGTAGSPEIASTFTPSCSVTGTGTGTAETFIYVATYVTQWGEESPPSAPSNAVTRQPGQTVTVTLPSAPTGNYPMSSGAAVRLYRSNTGTTDTQFQFVTEVAIGTASYADSKLSADLGEVLSSSTFTEPDDAMKGLTVLPNGGMMGFFDNQLCFSEPNYPHAWPIRYRRSMAAPIVAVAAVDSMVIVFTSRGTYLLNGTEPANMVESEAVIPQVCVSKRSVCKFDGGVVFAAQDGLYKISTSGIQNITASVLGPEDWKAYAPATILGLTTPTQYIGFFDTGTRQAGFVIRREADTTFTETDVYATAGYLEPSTSVLYLVTSGNLVKKWEAGSNMTMEWRAGVVYSPRNVTMSAARVEAEAYPVTFKFWRDGVLWSRSVPDANIFRLPGGARSRRFQCGVQGSSRVSYVAYAPSADELTERNA